MPRIPPFDSFTVHCDCGLTSNVDRAAGMVYKCDCGFIHQLRASPTVSTTKETNPKDAIGSTKAPLHLLSPIAELHWSLAQFAGNVKYGAWNFRAGGARATVYVAAAKRHLAAWLSGEEFDPVDGTHHLGNVMACAAILLEAKECGKLQDDRPPSLTHRRALEYVEGQMKRLIEMYADKNPRHYTIDDTGELGLPTE